jgi:hypothetical protein
MSPVKEPRFFSVDGLGPGSVSALGGAVSTWDDYLALFADARPDQARGEASVSYLFGQGVVDRVRQRLPDVRLVASLRHPAEAAWSRYWMARRLHGRAPAFEDLVAREPAEPASDLPPAGPLTYLVRSGLYHAHLRRWLDAFPPDRLLVLLHEDLLADRAATLATVWRHLGVDPDAAAPAPGPVNAGSNPRSRRLYLFLNRPGPVARPLHAVARRLPRREAIRRVVDGINARAVPPMPPGTRRLLLERYRDDTSALADLLGRDLSAWLR